MFYLADVHDVFATINGADQLRRLLTKPVTVSRRSSTPTVHNVWVVSGHVLVSLNDGTILLAFDYVPKRRPWPTIQNLIANPKTDGALSAACRMVVCDVFYYQHSQDVWNLVIVCCGGQVILWQFSRPAYEWTWLSQSGLCRGTNTHIISVAFSVVTQTLVWCERRTPTQCCICKCILCVVDGADGSGEELRLTNTTAVLHNCIPTRITLIDQSMFVFTPLANSNQELLLFWSSRTQVLRVFVWPFENNELLEPLTSSDYGGIVTNTLGLWITAKTDSQLPFISCVSGNGKELMILQADCRLFTLTLTSGQPKRTLTSTLQLGHWKDSLKRKPTRMFSSSIFIGLLHFDGNVHIFELSSGHCVTMISSLEKTFPRLWTCNDLIPKVGFWNFSGIWILKSDPVTKQAEDLVRVLSGNTSYDGPFRHRDRHHGGFEASDIERSPHNELLYRKRSGAIAADETLAELNFEVSAYGLTHQSLVQACLPAVDYLLLCKMRRHAALLVADIVCRSDGQIDASLPNKDIIKVLDLFDDPVLLLGVFYKRLNDRTTLNSRLSVILESQAGQTAACEENRALLENYLDLTRRPASVVGSIGSTEKHPETTMQSAIESALRDLSLFDADDIVVVMTDLCTTCEGEFVTAIKVLLNLNPATSMMTSVHVDDDKDVTVDTMESTKRLCWQIICNNPPLFRFLCNVFWEYDVDMLNNFIVQCCAAGSALEVTGHDHPQSMAEHLIRRSQDAVECLPTPSAIVEETSTDSERVVVYVDLLMMTQRSDAESVAAKVLLECQSCRSCFVFLAAHQSENGVHAKRLFHAVCKHLVVTGRLGDFATDLAAVLPKNFGMAQLCCLVRANPLSGSNRVEIFSNGYSAMSISSLQPLLAALNLNQGQGVL